MADSVHDVSVVLGTCWGPHTEMEHGTLHGLRLSPPLYLCLALPHSLSLLSLRLSAALQREQEREGQT